MLLSLSFRCRAATPPSEADLQALVTTMRERHRAAGVTGLLLYDDGCLFHWLEGPPDAVRAIWRQIQTDPHYAAVELLGECATPVRLFGGSDLQLLCRAAEPGSLRRVGGRDPASAAADLAACAVAGAGLAVDALLDSEMRAGRNVRSLRDEVIEPAARTIGDWRDVARCTDFEMTLALAHLQQSARRIGAAIPPPLSLAAVERTVLIAADQAEPSVLGVTLVGDVFREAGWTVEVAFPHGAAELCEAVRIDSYDVLALLLGDAVRHPDQLDTVAADIRAARAASRKPGLLVVVGGRIVLDRPDSLVAILDADGAFTTASDAIERVTSLLGLGAARAGPPARRERGAKGDEAPRRPAEIPPGWFWLP